jgi:hypothetical protein
MKTGRSTSASPRDEVRHERKIGDQTGIQLIARVAGPQNRRRVHGRQNAATVELLPFAAVLREAKRRSEERLRRGCPEAHGDLEINRVELGGPPGATGLKSPAHSASGEVVACRAAAT